MLIPTPEGQYIKGLKTVPKGIEVEYGSPKKVALLFICLNDRYWPYLTQVIQDAKKQFLPKHKVDFFVWTDYNEENKKKQVQALDDVFKEFKDALPEKKQEALGTVFTAFTNIVRLYEHFYAPQLQAALQEMANQGIIFKREGPKFWVESTHAIIDEKDVSLVLEIAKRVILLSQHDMDEALKGATILDTEAVPWPSPTLMRYHLFLNEEEKLKGYDYLFYMDADMRIVSPVEDEIIGEGLTAAEHPMYSLRKEYIPPYEPNKDSTAYIKRPGKVVDENGVKRFKPYYYAGGFQGGVSKDFIAAMQTMKKNIDKDFDNNYIAVWNDESHWNKYLSENDPAIVLSPAYIYPDSLIKEYYETKIWGRSYEPKIITLTKPFSLSSQGAEEINKFIQQ